MSTRRIPASVLTPLYPAMAAIVALSLVADSALLVGVSAGLALVVCGVLAWWWARRPADEWGERR